MEPENTSRSQSVAAGAASEGGLIAAAFIEAGSPLKAQFLEMQERVRSLSLAAMVGEDHAKWRAAGESLGRLIAAGGSQPRADVELDPDHELILITELFAVPAPGIPSTILDDKGESVPIEEATPELLNRKANLHALIASAHTREAETLRGLARGDVPADGSNG